ncbi:putative PurR-regulated permease PerM [Silvimonas terrae]|uniref:Putative PurR-regulated permease PerM n=1 Tax=Silvimonas terrae TaxID=300266 RepID=A0A840RDA2_9NEIS|nr:AI-2E family transporter [Silvimonas terrae]MBB5190406.1 putative PurR-regulated permease PerM [Silvimonas terrae]
MNAVRNLLKNDSTPTNKLAQIMGTATVLGLLYFGRDVLIPITLAIILSLLIAPLIRWLRRVGFGQVGSIVVAVSGLSVALTFVGLVIGLQVIHMAASLPQYEDTIRSKVVTLDEMTLGKLNLVTGQANRVISQMFARNEDATPDPTTQDAHNTANKPLAVTVQQSPPSPFTLLTRIATSVWGPLETAGIVFVVLIFVLLEHEALRDRLIRLIGSGDLRGTTMAVNDAGTRLSRFFVSQFAVNIAVGALIWLGLSLIGLSQALLWGVMAAVLRFVPYVGVWIAAFCATLLAAAIAPGWEMAVMTLGLFLLIEVLVAQLIEPQLYGHTTGLSPLSVVIAAIFWSWIWGPVGLVLSTPLTLCLVVAGRYIKGLQFLEILLGEVPALTMPENFYQRALSGDADEIIASARAFLKRKPLAVYCDTVLRPAVHMLAMDYASKTISRAEQKRVSTVIGTVIETLSGSGKPVKGNRRQSVLEEVSLGRQLRARREQQTGRWQGPINAPEGSVVLAVGLGSGGDELAAEILVRILRTQHIDGRHLALEDLQGPIPNEVNPEIVAVVFLISVIPETEGDLFDNLIQTFRERLPHAQIMAAVLGSPFELRDLPPTRIDSADQTLHTYEEMVQACSDVPKVQTPR